MTDRGPLQLAAFLALGLASLVLAYFYMSDGRAAYLDAERNLDRINEVKKRIVELRAGEDQAVFADQRDSFSSSTLVGLAARAGISERQIQTFEALPMRTIGDSEYLYEDLQLQLTGLTLEKLIRFATECENASSGFQVSKVQLTAQSLGASGGEELWDIDLILTRLVYDATNRNGG